MARTSSNESAPLFPNSAVAATDSGTSGPFRVGLNLMVVDGPLGPASWRTALEFATAADAAGLDAVWVPDHLLLDWGGTRKGTLEAWSVVSAVAARTSQVEVGTLVASAAFRNPALIAKMASTVDEISGGRFVLGLGAGWRAPEYAAFGYDSDHLVAKFEEALAIIVPLVRTGRVDFRGRYYRAERAEILPRGPRETGSPILIGGKGPRMLELVARYADRWNAQGPLREPSEVRVLRELADAACARVGRAPTSLRRAASIVVSVGPEGPTERWIVTTLALLREFAAEGLDEVEVWLDPPSIAAVEATGHVLERLRAEAL
jgi:alkanesulfonate monooxygenase SsuD/methylene tetrahydromethanopterin reductase-like flavin-dependent oxidoreductase (luciferase family)